LSCCARNIRAKFSSKHFFKLLTALDAMAESNLLVIVSRGSAIIAELLRLSENIPPVFYLSTTAERVKYGAILHDLSYIPKADVIESKITADVDLSNVDQEIKKFHLDLLERFYDLFHSIYQYITNLNSYLKDVEDGMYIHLQLEDLVQSKSGKQLLSEGIFLYGVMLALLENRIAGTVRERILVAYYRYKGTPPEFAKVSSLCRASSCHTPPSKCSNDYPEDLFTRLAPPEDVILMVLNRCCPEICQSCHSHV